MVDGCRGKKLTFFPLLAFLLSLVGMQHGIFSR